MSHPLPTEIQLHKKSRILEVLFEDGSHFKLSAEYLRVYSPSAEVRGHGPGQEQLQIGKENVGIERIEQVGHYAIQIWFDDGHSTGIYAWDTLYDLGARQDEYWQSYLHRLEQAGHARKPSFNS